MKSLSFLFQKLRCFRCAVGSVAGILVEDQRQKLISHLRCNLGVLVIKSSG